jgi:hypothetical protein
MLAAVVLNPEQTLHLAAFVTRQELLLLLLSSSSSSLLLTAVELSLDDSSPYTSTDKTNKNKYA